MPKNLDDLGLKSVANSYDVFFIDIWGVLHNGINLYQNSVNVLNELEKLNKNYILLTNAPRPNRTVIEFLKNMGLDENKCKKEIVKAINDLYDDGYRIIIYTSRYMGRSNEDIIKTYKAGYNFTLNQLNDWGLKFNELFLGKPRYDILVDDKSIFYKDDWVKNFPTDINN